MKGMLAVYRKEFATYFRSAIAYCVMAVLLLGTGYFFLYNVFLTGDTTMAGTFQNMGVLLLSVNGWSNTLIVNKVDTRVVVVCR